MPTDARKLVASGCFWVNAIGALIVIILVTTKAVHDELLSATVDAPLITLAALLVLCAMFLAALTAVI